MKFAKELEDDLVPEWRVKYFNYKLGKKKIKAVTRALKSVDRSPNSPRPDLYATNSADRLPYTFYDFSQRKQGQPSPDAQTTPAGEPVQAPGRALAKRPQLADDTRRESLTMFARSPPVLVPTLPSGDGTVGDQPSPPASPGTLERTPLHRKNNGNSQEVKRYGSIPRESTDSKQSKMTELALPGPAMDPNKQSSASVFKQSREPGAAVSSQANTKNGNEDIQQPATKKKAHFAKDMMTKALENEPNRRFSKAKLKKLFRSQPLDSPNAFGAPSDAIRELDARQGEFYDFMDKEIEKIEKFYRTKEDEASARLDVLREQLHEMRDRWLNSKSKGQASQEGWLDGEPIITSMTDLKQTDNTANKVIVPNIIKPLHKIIKPNRNGKNSKSSQAMQNLSSPPESPVNSRAANGDRSDYVRKKTNEEHVPYRFARRRLKLALQEFYRGLELLKSYALLNRTAFRKINKKYDKAVKSRPTLQYMANKVNQAHFVQSNIIEGHLVAVEDLYARYFERGQHKVAVNKLRSKMRQGDQSAVAFRNGLFVAAGAGLGMAGLVNAGRFLFVDDIVLKTRTSYLLQIYGGYFLALLLFLFFVVDCRIWTRARVNYVFVFEFDTRHVLDWRQLAELPCFFLFLNGLFLWLNFELESAHPMYLYWPVILIGLTLVIITIPAKVLHYHSRKWFGYSNWRLLLAGIYPVEFRDFFFGDMYCSETYSMSQIELFFCVYANGWENPSQCNSNHSMLLGFFTALPAVWRANQCLRRYYDTRSWFPHLANFTKYLLNIIYYMTLSLYRLQINDERRIVFIVFAAINGIYSSMWDVFMDWSLGNPWARHRFLRNNLAYRRVWVYYAAIVADVVLRHQWIFYAIFVSDLQHSAFMSFMVGLAEVIRRGIWSLFRVENEHCNNVKKFRASRDVPLPYMIDKKSDHVQTQRHQDTDADDTETDDRDVANTPASPNAPGSGVGTAVDLERQTTWDSLWSSASSLRQRKRPTTPRMRTLQRVGSMIAAAHAQDFTKKRREDIVGKSPKEAARDSTSEEDEDDDDDIDSDDEDQQSNDDEIMVSSPPQSPKTILTGTKTLERGTADGERGKGRKSRDSSVRRKPDVSTLDDGSASSSVRIRGARGGATRESEATTNTHLSVPTPQQRHSGARSASSHSTGYSDALDEDEADRQDEEDISEARERLSRARSPN